jgi:2,4-dienoyl-CoA reductase-like NADH-dependent reductase (Old Yellow Enzyme family)
VSDSHPEITFPYVAAELGKRKLAFLFIRVTHGPGALLSILKAAFGGPVVANDGYDFASATEAVTHGAVDAVAFGKHYIANPDLVRRLGLGSPLNPLVSETIYGSPSTTGALGYTDYPMLDS